MTQVYVTRSSQPRQAQIPGPPINLSGTRFPRLYGDGVRLHYWLMLESEKLREKGTQQLGSDPPVCSPALPGPLYLLSFEAKALRVSKKEKQNVCTSLPCAASLLLGVAALRVGSRPLGEAKEAEVDGRGRRGRTSPKNRRVSGSKHPSTGRGRGFSL